MAPWPLPSLLSAERREKGKSRQRGRREEAGESKEGGGERWGGGGGGGRGAAGWSCPPGLPTASSPDVRAAPLHAGRDKLEPTPSVSGVWAPCPTSTQTPSPSFPHMLNSFPSELLGKRGCPGPLADAAVRPPLAPRPRVPSEHFPAEQLPAKESGGYFSFVCF